MILEARFLSVSRRIAQSLEMGYLGSRREEAAAPVQPILRTNVRDSLLSGFSLFLDIFFLTGAMGMQAVVETARVEKDVFICWM